MHVAGRANCAPEGARVCPSGDAPVCASGNAPGKRRSTRSVRVGARGARVSGRARSTRIGARVASRPIRLFFSVGLSQSRAVVLVRWSGPVPRAAACQSLAPGGAGRPPLRQTPTASSSLSHAEAQRGLDRRAAWRVLSLRSVRATYVEFEERRHGARNTRVRAQLEVGLSSGDALST